jgi:hypothetical protein
MTSGSNPPSKHVSAFELDLLETGTLDAERTRRLNEHLVACESCGERQAELQAARSDFAADVFPRTAPRFRQPKPAPAVPTHRRASVWAPLLASAAALLLFVGFLVGRAPNEEPVAVQTKGGTGLSLVVRRDGRPIGPDDAPTQLRAGDELRFVLFPAGEHAKFVLVASVDGAGKANVYFPFEGDRSAAVGHAARWEVPGSVVLDGTPGPERIFALFSAQSLDARQVREQLSRIGAGGWQAVRSAARLELPAVDQHSVLIEKGAARPRE